jgi:hypothetical protein
VGQKNPAAVLRHAQHSDFFCHPTALHCFFSSDRPFLFLTRVAFLSPCPRRALLLRPGPRSFLVSRPSPSTLLARSPSPSSWTRLASLLRARACSYAARFLPAHPSFCPLARSRAPGSSVGRAAVSCSLRARARRPSCSPLLPLGISMAGVWLRVRPISLLASFFLPNTVSLPRPSSGSSSSACVLLLTRPAPCASSSLVPELPQRAESLLAMCPVPSSFPAVPSFSARSLCPVPCARACAQLPPCSPLCSSSLPSAPSLSGSPAYVSSPRLLLARSSPMLPRPCFSFYYYLDRASTRLWSCSSNSPTLCC